MDGVSSGRGPPSRYGCREGVVPKGTCFPYVGWKPSQGREEGGTRNDIPAVVPVLAGNVLPPSH